MVADDRKILELGLMQRSNEINLHSQDVGQFLFFKWQPIEDFKTGLPTHEHNCRSLHRIEVTLCPKLNSFEPVQPELLVGKKMCSKQAGIEIFAEFSLP